MLEGARCLSLRRRSNHPQTHSKNERRRSARLESQSLRPVLTETGQRLAAVRFDTDTLRMWRCAAAWLLLTAVVRPAAFAQVLTVDATNSPFVISTSATYAQVTVASAGTLIVNAPLTVTG